jgi:hypothetical protein
LTQQKSREHLFDFYRSAFMLFVFFHHVYLRINAVDFAERFNPFAELFVGLSGFMVGFVYLHRPSYAPLVKRGGAILAAYYLLSLPISIVTAMISRTHREPVVDAVLKCVFMLEDFTAIGILRFYGLMFILLPVILVCYKYCRRLSIYISSFVFIIVTFIYQSTLYKYDNFFVNNTVLVILQWQLFFVFGLFLGDEYRNKTVSTNQWKVFMCSLIAMGIALNYSVYDVMSYDKTPYTFGKFINLMWSAPIVVFLLYHLYHYLKGGGIDRYVRVVGRNSLISFLVSEVVVQLIRLLLYFNMERFHWEMSSLLPLLSGLVAILIITLVMWIYQHFVRGRGILGHWSR